jgi:polysaccharide export outer membrane protein
MKRILAIAVITWFAVVGAQALAQGQAKSQTDTAAPAPAAPASNTSYIIGADDVLQISVWKEPDLTTTLPVRPDGNISLPLLNDVPAAGLTPMQLAANITEKLRKYVADPRVTVLVAQINSKKFYVTGEVQHTGGFQLLPGMTVLQALAQAGFTQFANTKGIYLLRNENGRQQKIPVNYKRLIKGDAAQQNIALKAGDTIVVP